MYIKIQITGYMEVATGLHIGASGAFSAIGSVDSPVVRDPLERIPLIPGSSLKGKMRTLLAKYYNDKIAEKPDDDNTRILGLFGSTLKGSKFRTGRLLFSDMLLANATELRDRGVDNLTEVKFENTINRISAEANPRQIERVIRGSKFDIDLIYGYYEQTLDDLLEDFEIIGEGFRLLQYDYLGGNGSRGYGKVMIYNLNANTVVGEIPIGMKEQIDAILKKVGDVYGI